MQSSTKRIFFLLAQAGSRSDLPCKYFLKRLCQHMFNIYIYALADACFILSNLQKRRKTNLSNSKQYLQYTGTCLVGNKAVPY